PAILRLLLEAGADINHRTEGGFSALAGAMAGDDEETLRILLEYQPEVNFQDDDGNTPLNKLSDKTGLDMVKLLVRRGADIENRNKFEATPLFWAIYHNRADII